MKKKIWFVVLVAGMLAIMPVKIGGLNQPFPVYGYIKDSNGNAVANAAVYIKDISKSTYIVAYTNENGYYQANLYDLENCENGDTINVSCSYNNGLNYAIFILDVTESSKNVSFNLIAPPIIGNSNIYDITSNSARINVSISSLGGDNYCKIWIEYGSNGYVLTTTKQTIYSPSTITFSLTNLKSDTTYHYRIVAQNSRKIAYTGDSTFTTLASLPMITTLSATGITYSKATLRGYLNVVGAKTCEVWFVYDDEFHSNWQDYAHSTLHKNISIPSSFSFTIEGLQINKTYHFRAIAKNKAGISYGNDVTFTTHMMPPTVETLEATNVTSDAAILHGKLLDLGGSSNCQVWFEYGTTTSYGSVTPVINATSSFSLAINGLQPGKTYHFRAIAKNKAGISYGNDVTFTTSILKASVSTQSISYAVILHGKLLDLGGSSNCQVWFEYGTTTSYGNSTNKILLSHPGEFNAVISGLEQNKTYHYRAVVENSKGITYGNDMTFKMLSLPSSPAIITLNASLHENGTATLYGNVSLNGNNYCYVWFEYWKEGGEKHTTKIKIMNHDGMVNETIKVGIGNYSYEAVAVGSGGTASYGGARHFHVVREFNHIPSIVALYPLNGSVAGMNASLGVRVEDADNDTMILTFYWGNGSIIYSMECENGIHGIALHNLKANKIYSWYAVVSDGMDSNSTPIIYFWTQKEIKSDFYWQPSLIAEGDIVQFFDNSTGATSWHWNFGDGNMSNESNPSHIFKHGIYKVTLTVYNENGSFDSITKELHVYKIGDVNMDDKINALDVTKAEIMMEMGAYSKLADIDRNGIIDGKDIDSIIKMILGIK